MLILANEDYTGVNPDYPDAVTAPKYADEYAAALDANGVSHDTFDVDAQGVPHHLGVLGHYDAVVWELGDNRLTQDPEDLLTDTYLFGPVPDLAVAERQQYLTLAVRDYLNEGGKLVHSGETAQYHGQLGGSVGGIYYGLDGRPDFFAGTASSTYLAADGTNPFAPIEGERYAGALHADESYTRLTRTIDLSDLTAADSPALAFQLSTSTELGYDNVIVEAAPAGTTKWTTLPEAGGATSPAPPTECEGGFLLEMHPFLTHYLTPGDPCANTGTTGEWHAITGDTGGWQQVSYDLSAYAGGSVDVAISYVTDPAAGGIGVFVDDTRVTTAAGDRDIDGFEGDTSLWSIPGAPEGSPGNLGDFQVAGTLVEVAASVTTDDTVLLGYGIEQLATPAEQADWLGRILTHLLG